MVVTLAGRLANDSWAKLESRGVLKVQGVDAKKYLQGLTTNDMLTLGAPLPPRDTVAA